jgi:hypothetical protein
MARLHVAIHVNGKDWVAIVVGIDPETFLRREASQW